MIYVLLRRNHTGRGAVYIKFKCLIPFLLRRNFHLTGMVASVYVTNDVLTVLLRRNHTGRGAVYINCECLIQYYYVEIIQAGVQCLWTVSVSQYYYVEIIQAGVQCILTVSVSYSITT